MSWRRWLRIGIAGLLALVAVLAGAAADDAACLGCHPAAASAWKTSHHARAQQTATAGNVLGNFDDVWFVQGSRRVRFFRRGEDYLIRTEGPDGQPADFPVRYTLGVYPLQQYLLPLPGPQPAMMASLPPAFRPDRATRSTCARRTSPSRTRRSG